MAFSQRELHETASTTIEGAVVQLKLPHGLHFVSATGADARLADEDSLELRSGSLFSKDERRAIVHLTARLDPGESVHLGATADWTQVVPKDGSPFVLAHVDVQHLHFRKAEGRNNNVLTCVSAVFNRNGNFLQGTAKTVTMHWKDETLEHKLSSGITLKTSFDVKPGSYLVRLVVRDSEGQLMSAENGSVEIR